MEKEKRRTYAVCAYTFSPPFRSQQTKFFLGPALCTEHIWCKYRNTWEDSFRTSTSYADSLAEHSQLSAKPTASLSDPTFCVMLHGDCNPGYQRHIRNLVLCWFGHLSLLRHLSTKPENNQGTACRSRERCTGVITQLAQESRRGTTTSKTCRYCTQGRTWQAGPCPRILRQKQF